MTILLIPSEFRQCESITSSLRGATKRQPEFSGVRGGGSHAQAMFTFGQTFRCARQRQLELRGKRQLPIHR